VKYGVTFPQTEIGADPAVIREFAQTAEAAGFDYLVAFDHVLGAHLDRFAGRDLVYGTPPYLYKDQFHEPFALFSYLAGVTKQIELTTSVIILPQRQTALVAKQAAAVDLLSGQRLRLGVGIGWNFTEYEALGEDFHTRGARQEEQITVLRKLWTEDLVTYEGRWHKFDRVGINPRPPRPIPIWIGSGFKDQILRRVARLADGWMPLFAPGQDPAPILDRLRSHLAEEGRDAAGFGLQTILRIERGSESDWVHEAKQFRSAGVTHLGMGGIARGTPPMKALEKAIAVKELVEGVI
jgi:probable F420-dependent oxidoreductase